MKQNYMNMLLSTGIRWDLAENPYFKIMIEGTNPTAQYPCGSTMKTFGLQKFTEMKEDIMRALSKCSRVSVTTDLWSSFNCKSTFLGVVCHGFNSERKQMFCYRLALR